ncbi:hypothetical protein LA6_000915 [Marinibacterium anthonyi]|nr:hypothetical protein LA6_000915 [Marinibacterium anthonyi]
MSFIRPEARAHLMRWREVLIGGAMALVGLSWAMGPGGLLGWLGWVLVAAGAALVVTGVRRMRFRRDGLGPGVVQVDEGRISYFGPLEGGAVSASELERVILDPTNFPPCWVLEQPGWPPLHIPVNASGSDALFDAFGALPGLDTRRLLSHLNRKAPMPVVVWERRTARPHNYRLH